MPTTVMRTAKQSPVLTLITGYARHVDGLLIPSRNGEDLFAGWWRLLERLGAVPHVLHSQPRRAP